VDPVTALPRSFFFANLHIFMYRESVHKRRRSNL